LDSGRAWNTVKVRIAAISAFHIPFSGFASLGLIPLVNQFMKGAFRIKPPYRNPLPCWDLNVVLIALMEKPYEPMAKASLEAVTFKTAFLVAIASTRRCSELHALDIRKPFMRFGQNGVTLRTNPSFMPKVPSEFHLNEEIYLPRFYHQVPAEDPDFRRKQAFHTLDVFRALRYYLEATKSIRGQSSQLFVSFHIKDKDGKLKPISKQRLGKWLKLVVHRAYNHFGKQAPEGVKAHSTRAQGSSWAELNKASPDAICKAATWKQLHTFSRHYRLDLADSAKIAVGRAILGAASRS
jgi:hypothetical protein